MERGNNGNGEVTKDSKGWEDWEAVPRDGPAVFAVDIQAFDQGVVRGRWLEVTADQATLNQELADLLGRKPDAGTWAVVDQVGLGGLMVPETMTVTDLAALAEYLATESQV